VDEFPILNTLSAVEISSTIVTQWTLEEINAESLVHVLQFGGELEVRGHRAGSIGTARRHNPRYMDYAKYKESNRRSETVSVEQRSEKNNGCTALFRLLSLIS
jgi:hypothetical protein